MSTVELVLPSTGPDPIPLGTALAAVLGYACGRRPWRFRSISHPDGKWALVPAFGYERFDRHPLPGLPLGEVDILIGEGLHGRLPEPAWTAVRDVLPRIAPLADDAVARAAGRPFWELPDDEFSVLAEPGTVGHALRRIWHTCRSAAGVEPPHVVAALHHRWPALVPLVSGVTRRQLVPHLHEGDSEVEAVVHRELRANADAFEQLEQAVAQRLETPLTRLRLHDVLLWLSGSLRLTHAVALGHGLGPPGRMASASAVREA